jgi:succinyl-CoA synthetase beta subunit
VAALAKALAAVSRFAAAAGDSLESLDINPLAVLPDGEGVLALDALIVPARG